MNNVQHDEEMVAWVDEDEKLIKVIPISLANSDHKYLHREIAGIIVDDDRRVLLQQRAATKRVLPSVWTVTVAGHVTYGDTLEKTFAKELKEEMNLTLSDPVYLFRERVEQWTEAHFCHWYLGKYEGGDIQVQSTEVDRYAWLSEQEYPEFIKKHNVHERTKLMLKRFWSGEWDTLLWSK